VHDDAALIKYGLSTTSVGRDTHQSTVAAIAEALNTVYMCIQKGLVHAGCLVTLYLLLQAQALLLAHAPAGFSLCFKSCMAPLILKAQLPPIGAPWIP
jgi:hypothetical protein